MLRGMWVVTALPLRNTFSLSNYQTVEVTILRMRYTELVVSHIFIWFFLLQQGYCNFRHSPDPIGIDEAILQQALSGRLLAFTGNAEPC